ncbi:TIR domain-containing protein [Algoriphagus terrigena]|uniref:TIR domain-containing protein n=1 Tax=Algoriphagus terrigena TaxID=344884 RepID=UPI00040C74CB|nr:nucleotide-binding protein [Algoriphagus terrigena]
MSKETITLAKAAALKKSFDQIKYGRGRCLGQTVEPLFPRYTKIIESLKELNPELYEDLPEIEIPMAAGQSTDGLVYEQHEIEPLVQNLDYILELSANARIGMNLEKKDKSNRVFISHGRSNEWFTVQTYLEKDLNIATLELAQEPNIGRTVLQKLSEESDKCSIAVIVMTGDDITEDGEIRARENVMHEIGYFQGKYGLGRVVLLHEQGVNIPSNIQGLVYIGFPQETIDAALGALTREMKVLIYS